MYNEKENLTIYAVKVDKNDEEEYVLAESIDDAISKFQNFYRDDYYHYNDKITSIRVAFEYEVIK